MEQSMPRKRTSEYATVFCKAHSESQKQCKTQAFPFEAQAFAGFNILNAIPFYATP